MPASPRRREEYEIEFTEEDILKVSFDRISGKVARFSVQYIALIADKWHPILRMDTAHGKAHQDVSKPDGSQVKEDLPVQDYNEALTWSIGEIKRRWEFYRRRYERWMK
jgi:hypothetical protein